MYLYNTTFAVHEKIAVEFSTYMNQEFIPTIPCDMNIEHIRFCRLVMEAREGYLSFAFQFEIPTLNDIRNWKQN